MTILPELRGFKDKLGRQTLYVRITEKGKRRYQALNIRLLPDEWDKDTLQVKPNHPNHKQLNSIVRRRLMEEEITPSLALSTNFKNYVIESVGQWERTKAEVTLQQYRNELKKMKDFPLLLQDITVKTLQTYQDKLYSLGYKSNTIWKSMRILKTIMHKAKREGLIDRNPFDIFQSAKYKDPPKLFLSKSQVDQIEQYLLTAPGELLIVGTWFLIGCYTGLRFGDLKRFSENQIKSGRLIIYTQKTREVVSIPLSNKLLTFFKRVEYKPLQFTNQYANQLIKSVATLSGIEESISFHTARHTFATMALTAGIRMEVVSKLLGHSSLKTTSVYAKLIDSVVDEEMKKMG